MNAWAALELFALAWVALFTFSMFIMAKVGFRLGPWLVQRLASWLSRRLR